MASNVFIFSKKDGIELKKTIAQQLYAKDVEQSKISSILELSQPMVSNYCSASQTKRKDLIEHAESITNYILKNQQTHIHNCILFSDKPLKGPYYIAEKHELINDENRDIIEDLHQSFIMIKHRNLKGLIPKIKINIAQAIPTANSSDEVAAFVNGFIIMDDEIIGHNGIRFGCSSHLSSLLINIRKSMNVQAIMNIAYLPDFKDNSFSYEYLDKDYSVKAPLEDIDLLFHKGDFGIEPCTYIVGSDAIDVSTKLLRILDGDIV